MSSRMTRAFCRSSSGDCRSCFWSIKGRISAWRARLRTFVAVENFLRCSRHHRRAESVHVIPPSGFKDRRRASCLCKKPDKASISTASQFSSNQKRVCSFIIISQSSSRRAFCRPIQAFVFRLLYISSRSIDRIIVRYVF